MSKEELARIITEEAEKKGYTNMIINQNRIEELNQTSFIKQRNCEGLKLYAAWYTDKVFILAVWSNGIKRLTVLENVIIS